jgi:hypothetical protein
MIILNLRYILMSAFATLLVIVILSSTRIFKNDFIRCFDVINNVKKIFRLETDENEITCINGIRSLAMAMIVFWHTIYLRMSNRDTTNSGSYMKFVESWKPIFPITLGGVALEAFFVMSAILLTRNIFSDIKK